MKIIVNIINHSSVTVVVGFLASRGINHIRKQCITSLIYAIFGGAFIQLISKNFNLRLESAYIKVKRRHSASNRPLCRLGDADSLQPDFLRRYQMTERGNGAEAKLHFDELIWRRRTTKKGEFKSFSSFFFCPFVDELNQRNATTVQMVTDSDSASFRHADIWTCVSVKLAWREAAGSTPHNY